jgi:aminoglycoside phosphotransferase (APT) family kinase protein
MTDAVEPPWRAALVDVVATALGVAAPEVRDLRRMSGGASRETWCFDAVAAGDRHRLVLRRGPGTDGALMLLEAAAMREATRAGVPEPEVLAAEPGSRGLGAPYVVMRHIDGETIARRILREDAYAAIRPELAGQCGRILAAVHRMDIDALPPMPDVDALTGLRELFDLVAVESPTLELAFRWLAANRPAQTRRTVVHGDFRNGNLIVGEDGVRAVLDWELVHVGDPIEDLGWLCTRAWRFGGAAPVGGFGAYEDLLTAYEAASGVTVPHGAVRWWELYGTVRWGVICVMQADRHLSGARRSVELATIGRRLAEQEHDCLRLLEELADPAGAPR